MLEPLHAAPAIATLGFILLIFGSIFFHPLWLIFRAIVVAAIFILIFSGIHAAWKYRSARMLYLVPLVMPIQILGYGLGFITTFFYRVILGQPEFTGFKKKYYQ